MLKMRMKILRDGGIITPETAQFMERVIDLMEETFPALLQEHGERFTTHMAMAVERIRSGELAEPLAPDAWEEVSACGEYAKSLGFLARIIPFSPVEFPDSERQYLLLHLCTMLAEG